MKTSRIPLILLSLCVFSALFASMSVALATTTPSGFIVNLPADMQPDSAGSATTSWLSPTAKLANYDRILFQPLVVQTAPDSEVQALDSDSLRSLSHALREVATRDLAPAYTVADQPEQGVLVIRAALTDAYLEKQQRKLLSFTPIGMLVHAGKDTHVKRFALTRSTLEIEAIDGTTGERVAILIDRAPEKTGAHAGPRLGARQDAGLDWNRLETALSFYAKRLLDRLNAAHASDPLSKW